MTVPELYKSIFLHGSRFSDLSLDQQKYVTIKIRQLFKLLSDNCEASLSLVARDLARYDDIRMVADAIMRSAPYAAESTPERREHAWNRYIQTRCNDLVIQNTVVPGKRAVPIVHTRLYPPGSVDYAKYDFRNSVKPYFESVYVVRVR